MPYNVFVIFLASSQNIRPLKVCLCKIRSCLKIEIQLKVIARAEQILGRQDLSGMHLKDKEEEDTLFVFFQPHHSKSFWIIKCQKTQQLWNFHHKIGMEISSNCFVKTWHVRCLAFVRIGENFAKLKFWAWTIIGLSRWLQITLNNENKEKEARTAWFTFLSTIQRKVHQFDLPK